ncbi:MAG: nuclear transport factor 2 family protein [Novosphingobium sp.]|nr:nuclear transport factor 2 family protein [Novosphingobium sp.]
MRWSKTGLCGMVAAALIMTGATTSSAAEAPGKPLIAPGGLLDPAYPDADVYIGIPESPDVPPGKACEIGARYVELVNAGKYAEVAALYADDATFLEPMRPNLHGRKQIDEFYTKRIGAMAPQVMAVSWFGNETECLVDLALQTKIDGADRWVLVSVDHFIVGADGKIKSMTAFARPQRGE